MVLEVSLILLAIQKRSRLHLLSSFYAQVRLSEVPPSAGETVEEISVPVMESAFVRVKVRSGRGGAKHRGTSTRCRELKMA